MKKIFFSIFLSAPLLLAHSGTTTTTGPGGTDSTTYRETKTRTTTTWKKDAKNSDSELTRLIRSQIMQDETLSSDAKNVRVMVENNNVTLRGTVQTQSEKEHVAGLARKVDPSATVNNEIDVAE